MSSPVKNISKGRTADTADLSTTLLRSSGRDDKGEGGASSECGCRTEAIFHHLGRAEGPCLLRSKTFPGDGPLTPQISPLRSFGAPVEMTKGRAALPATVVAEQDPFFIALGGPKAHDSSGRKTLPRKGPLTPADLSTTLRSGRDDKRGEMVLPARK